MMSVLAQPASRKYKINNAWLDAFANDPKAYVDIAEIQNFARQQNQIREVPAYVQWLIDNGHAISADQEAQKAGFTINGIHVGDADRGPEIRGFLFGENPEDAETTKFTQGQTHPLRFRRIYARQTHCRHLWIVGF